MKRILIIDDEQPIRHMLSEMLAPEGYEILEAVEGKEGMKLLRNSPCDLVITDLHMPGQEGLETISMLRKDYPEVKIIAISGGSPRVAQDFLPIAKLMGAGCVIYKPILQKELLKAVGSVFREEGSR